MGRAEKRIYTVGRFWLAKREQSPFYQIGDCGPYKPTALRF